MFRIGISSISSVWFILISTEMAGWFTVTEKADNCLTKNLTTRIIKSFLFRFKRQMIQLRDVNYYKWYLKWQIKHVISMISFIATNSNLWLTEWGISCGRIHCLTKLDTTCSYPHTCLEMMIISKSKCNFNRDNIKSWSIS